MAWTVYETENCTCALQTTYPRRKKRNQQTDFQQTDWLTIYGRPIDYNIIDGSKPTYDWYKLYTSLSANTIMAKLTNQFQRTRLITSSPDKHYSIDSEDDFHSGCRNVSHQQQFFSELPSPGRSQLLILPGSNHLLCLKRKLWTYEPKRAMGTRKV